jgi:hypothetical protein
MNLVSTYTATLDQGDDVTLVRAWRAEQLCRLGLPPIVAAMFADLVDWHAFADLVERGCSPALALEIVR